jgi:hypothetical protein
MHSHTLLTHSTHTPADVGLDLPPWFPPPAVPRVVPGRLPPALSE